MLISQDKSGEVQSPLPVSSCVVCLGNKTRLYSLQPLREAPTEENAKCLAAEIKDIQTFMKALDKHNYTELRDYNIVLLILDTGIRTSELMAIKNEDCDPEAQPIFIRPDVAKTSRSGTLCLSGMTNTSLRKFLKVKPKE